MKRRHALALIPMLACALPAMAAWPERPLVFVVPYAAGTNADIFARRFGSDLSKALGQPVVIDNRPGANSTLGLDKVAKSAPDGYTFGHAATTNTVLAPMLQKSVPYDYRKDLQPISSLYQTRTAMVVAANSPFTTYAQLLAYARANPDKVSYGYAQSTAQISGANWRQVTGLKIAAIPYKGTPQAIVDLMGGQIPVAFAELSIAVPLIATNKIRALAVVAPDRSSLLPNVPTFAEVQPNGATIVGFSGLMMPAGTPRDIVERLAQATRAIVSEPDFVKFLAGMGLDPMVLPTPAAFNDYLEKLEPTLRQHVKEAGMVPQ